MAGRSMFNSIAGAIMKILTILLLASQPFWGIKGVAMGVNVSIVVVTLLHLHTLGRKIGYHLDIKNLTKVVGAALVMGMVCEALSRMLEGQYPLLIATLLAITGGLMAYLLFLLATNGLKKSDFKRALSGGKKRKK
jgi:stage V sporulation protein B